MSLEQGCSNGSFWLPPPRCKNMGLTHLSFADDILVFTDGVASSLQGIMSVLDDFGKISGLFINASKSSIYTAGRNTSGIIAEAGVLGLPLDTLPIRYLGLPLTTKTMTRQDYEPLVDRIRSRLLLWSCKRLSFAGRLQLIQSVIASITNFWCSVFRLPKRCFEIIGSLCNAFLRFYSIVFDRFSHRSHKNKGCLGGSVQA